MDTALKVSQISKEMGYPITCIGIPKTRLPRLIKSSLQAPKSLLGKKEKGRLFLDNQPSIIAQIKCDVRCYTSGTETVNLNFTESSISSGSSASGLAQISSANALPILKLA